MSNPFAITVFDKSLVRQAIISTPLDLRCIPRFNAVGTCNFSMALDHPALGTLMSAGSRAVIDYFGEQTLSGMVMPRSINGPTISGSATFIVEDDFSILRQVLGWPVPTSVITNQTAKEKYVLTGPAETVLKTLVLANVATRLGNNVTCAPDLGRGDVITLEIRMEPLFDKLLPLVEDAGLGISVTQGATSLVVDVYEPTTYLPLLSEESGIVQDWSWTNTPPSATDVIVGGRGEKAAREFRRFTDDTAAALWGRRTEVFIDASDVGQRLNDWYSRFQSATEALARSTATYNEENKELTRLDRTVRNAKNAKVAVDGIYPSGSPERADALSDYNSAVSSKNSQATQVGTALADKNADTTTLNGINAEYAAIRAEYEALIAARANEKLKETGEKTGIRMVLSETDGFRYGDAVNVGDKVSMLVGPSLSITDTLREAELTWTSQDGVKATPSVGNITDNPDRVFAKALRNSATRIRKIEVR
jgi:prefoldin subunit 5